MIIQYYGIGRQLLHETRDMLPIHFDSFAARRTTQAEMQMHVGTKQGQIAIIGRVCNSCGRHPSMAVVSESAAPVILGRVPACGRTHVCIYCCEGEQ
eukprot:1835309-Pleurochrysis_carterae.AAC.6